MSMEPMSPKAISTWHLNFFPIPFFLNLPKDTCTTKTILFYQLHGKVPNAVKTQIGQRPVDNSSKREDTMHLPAQINFFVATANFTGSRDDTFTCY